MVQVQDISESAHGGPLMATAEGEDFKRVGASAEPFCIDPALLHHAPPTTASTQWVGYKPTEYGDEFDLGLVQSFLGTQTPEHQLDGGSFGGGRRSG